MLTSLPEEGEGLPQEELDNFAYTTFSAPKEGSPRYLLLEGQKYRLPESLWEAPMELSGCSQDTFYYTLRGEDPEERA